MLYQPNHSWRRNPKKFARALAHIRAKIERDRATAEVDSATRRYEEIKKEADDGSMG